jgi:hypothetical protein
MLLGMFSALRPSIGQNGPQCIDRERSAVSSNFEGYRCSPARELMLVIFPMCNLTSVETFPLRGPVGAVFDQAAPLI